MDLGKHYLLPKGKTVCFLADNRRITCGQVLNFNDSFTAFKVPPNSIGLFPTTSISIVDPDTNVGEIWGAPSLQNLIVYKFK